MFQPTNNTAGLVISTVPAADEGLRFPAFSFSPIPARVPSLHNISGAISAATMTVNRLILSLRRYFTTTTTNPSQTPIFTSSTQTLNPHLYTQSPSQSQNPQSSAANPNPSEPRISPNRTDILQSSTSRRSYGFSSAEEAAAERRRLKRRLRIEPPFNAVSSNRPHPTTNEANKPRLPDPHSAVVGPRLALHNRVQSLVRAGDLDSASYVARQSVFQLPHPTVHTCNAIITAMYRANRVSEAEALFQYFFNQFDIIPSIASYNTLILCHCKSNEIDDALKVYQHILENAPYTPSAITYRHLTKGLVRAGRIDEAVSLLCEMLHKGHAVDSLVYNNLIVGYLDLGNLNKAKELFDELKELCPLYDGTVTATFMDWFFKQGKPKEAMELYRDLMYRKHRMVPVQRNVLLETLLRHGRKKDAWKLFDEMLDDHTSPVFMAVNSETFNIMVNECFKEGKITEAMEVFKRTGKAEKSRRFLMDVAGYNNMLARLCEVDMIDEAEEHYMEMRHTDANSYKILIDAYMKVERIDKMLEKYTKMVDERFRVIPAYANEWFGFLIRMGRVLDCVPILSKMSCIEPKPDFTTYNLVIRGLIEGGNYDATLNLLSEMVVNGVGTTVLFKEFVFDVFEKQGRRMEVENIFNRFSSPFLPRKPYVRPRGSPHNSN